MLTLHMLLSYFVKVLQISMLPLTYCWQIGDREKLCKTDKSHGKSRADENIKSMACLYSTVNQYVPMNTLLSLSHDFYVATPIFIRKCTYRYVKSLLRLSEKTFSLAWLALSLVSCWVTFSKYISRPNSYPNACMPCRETFCTILIMVFGMT